MMNKIQRILFTAIAVWVVTFCYAGTVVLKTTTNGTITAKVNNATIAGPSDNSTDKVSTDQAGGTTVTLEIAPEDGYYLYQLAITPYASGGMAGAPRRSPTILNNITPTKIDDNKYTFIMPANMEKVEVSATFALQGDLSSAVVTLQSNNHTFDFLYHTPVVSSVVLNSITLTEGTDYTVTGNDPVRNVQAGGYTITVTGKGKYTGSKTATYMVNPRSISDASITLSGTGLSGTSFVYLKGVKQTAEIIGVYVNGQSLTSGSDYEDIKYYVGDYSTTAPTGTAYTKDDVPSENAGTYTIVIKGKGNFDGTTVAKKTYSINKKNISTCTVVTNPTDARFTYTGEAQTLGITVKDTNGSDLTAGTDYTVSGNVQTAVGGYTATVSAKDINYTGSVNVPFTINVSNDGYYISYSNTSYSTTLSKTYTGSQITPDANIFVKKKVGADPADSDPVLGAAYYQLVYNNNINVGTATVTAIGKGGYDFMTNATFEITAKDITNNNNITITLGSETLTYNGSKQRPSITVHDGDRNVDLRENIDYTLSDGAINAGTTHTVTVTGIGNYTGSKASGNYTIAKLSLSSAEVTLGTTNYVYDGTAKKPEVRQVKVGDLVIPSTDYTVGYSSNTNAGTAIVTISPKTSDPINLSGSASTTYTISPKSVSDLTITLNATSFAYDGTEQKPTVTVKDGSTTLVENSGYTLIWPTASTEVGSYSVTITGTGNYTGSINKTYVINYGTSDDDFTVTITGDYIYNGSALTPSGAAVVVKKGESTTLTAGTDYSLSYRDNINAGTATVTATGTGNYQFVQTGTFTIQPKTIMDDMATLSGTDFVSSNQSFVYNAALQKPTVTIMDGTKKLVEGTDYTLVNDGGTNVASYNATITGIGNYTTGTGLVKNYSITALSLAGASVVIDPLQSYVYDGTEKRPGVQQVKVGNVVIPAADYAVTYPRDATPASTTNVNAGNNTAEVYINPATGNLSDSKTQNFSITKKALTSEMITLSSTASDWQSNSFVYNGSLRKPDVAVSDIPTGLTSSIITASDYDITNDGGTEVGVYYVTVTATAAGNYSGTIKVPYSIVSDNAENDVTITLSDGDDLVYSGNPITRTITVKKGTTPNVTTLELNTDYEVVYNNNINVGQATITILGKGNYHFVQYAYFDITPKPLTAAMVTISENSFVYNGNVQKPNVTVTDGSVLTEGKDYTLINNGSTDVGDNYTASVTGIGNYQTTVSSPVYAITSLSIEGAEVTLHPLADRIYNGSPKTPTVQKITVTPVANGPSYVFTSGYTVSYENNTNVAVGTTKPTVKVTGGANFGNTIATTTFDIDPKPLTDGMVALAYTSVTYTGGELKPGVTVTDVALPGADKTVASTNYVINYPADVTDPGEKEVQIVGQNNYSGTIVKKYVINKIGVDDITVTIDGTYTYNGAAQTPHDADANHTNNITVKKGTTPLTYSTDYNVTYLNNKNAGTATAIITGVGNYSFTVEQTFPIAKRALSDATITLTGVPSNTDGNYYTYDGTLKKPGVSVTDVVNSMAIISSKDYTITNEGNINASSTAYMVTISSNEDGNYMGEVTRTYEIKPYVLPATTAVTLDLSTFIYDGDNKTPNVLVVKVGELIVPTYSTAYANNLNAALSTAATAPTVTVTASGNFSGSITKTFTISPKPVTADMIVIPEAQMNMVYTGGVLKPTPTIQDLKDPNDANTNIITTADYTLTNDGGTEVGNYEVKIVGKQNYTGTAKKQYSIVAKESEAAFTIAAIADQTYTGSPITPTVTVYKAGTTTPLTPGTDYDVAYSDNVNVGTATVTVTGKGNYASTKTTTFKITAKTLTEDMVHLSTPTTFTYNGKIQKPTVIVSDGNAMTALDYTIINDDHSDANTYNVEVIGTHNYTGSITKPYTINPLSITGASVTLEALTFTYNATAQKPAVSEVKVGDLIVPSTDYTIGYPADATSHGQKTITITAQNNFTGTITKDYTISPKPVNEDMIILTSGSYLEYTGGWLKPTVTVKDGGTVMVESTATAENDYTLTNDGAVNVGQYTVSIEGHGNYMGGASKVYNIIAAGSAGFTIADIDDVTYNGTTQEPTVVVRDANTGTLLTKDVNYYIIFTNNKNAGTALASVTGIGNYQGTATKPFKINPKTLTEDMVQITGYTLTTGDGFIYNGAVQKPAVMVADGSAMTADDYVVVNNGGLNVNETSSPYEITITGSNNYTGSVTKTFNILPLSIEDAAITLYQLPDKAYDGTEKKPGVREVMTGANIMVPTVGYDVAYSNNINAGTANVTVTGKNNFTGTASTTFEIEKKAVNSSMMTLSQENFNYTGSTQKPTVTISDKNGDTERITTDDYTLYNDGGIEVGNYKVKIVGKRNYKGEAEKQYSIWEKDAVINNFIITLGETSVEYDGTEKKPAVTVKDGDKKLDAETDYTVDFSDNTNAGIATVTVTGKGNYTGTRNTTFEITKKPLTAAMITVSGYTTADGFIYNGKNQAPTVEVRDGTALKTSDYVITNNGGVNQGTYHAIVTATGNYSGEFDYPYVIAKRNIEGAKVTLYELESYVYDGKAKKPGVKEVAFGEDVIPTAGYAVTYSNNIDAGTATVTVTGQGNYTGTLTAEFTIERKTLTADMIVLSNEEYVYNGTTQKPVVVLMNGDTEMVLDTDYTLTNEGGVSVGKYDVIANGKGNYNGMATKQFSIISKGIGSFEVTLSTEQVVYTGSEHRPTVTVKDGDKTLTPGSEYSVSYTDNTNAGTATVTITGQGEYSGTTTKTFIIKPKPLTEDMVFLSSTSYVYNTLQQKPTVTVSDQSFLTTNDYILTNDGGIDHGDYDVVVIGRNNYTGTIIKQFTIKPLSIETARVVLYEMASYVYDGTAKNPGVREVSIGSTIVPTSSYTVEISPNINVGVVTVTVTGKENFTGTASTTFEITPKPITDYMVILSEEVFYYNGALQRPTVEVKDGEKMLVEETDYTIVNEGGTEVGSYEVKVTGLGNYTSEVIKTYVIERSDFSVDITATDEEQKEFGVSLIVSLIDEDSNNIRVKGIKIPETEKDKEINLTIPATCTVDGVTYTITEIAATAFEDAENLCNLYLPDTEEALTIGDNAIPATTTIHTSLALLDDYALMPSLGGNFSNDKVMTTVKAKNQYWTFSSGVDVYVPENITVFIVQERTATTVAIVELTSTELNVSGANVIKSNNGVLLYGNSNTSYDVVACPRRMSSGTFISTNDYKDYGEENCLEPVIEATHYEQDYYVLKDNKFCSIKLEGEEVKVPAGKAVLYLPAAVQGINYSMTLEMINDGTTGIHAQESVTDDAPWYDLSGRRIEGRPTKKGVYIQNGRKVVIK